MKNAKDKNLIIVYDCESKSFFYPDDIQGQLSGSFDARPIWQVFKEDEVSTAAVAEQIREKVEEVAVADTPQAFFSEYFLKEKEGGEARYHVGIICPVPGEAVSVTFSKIETEDSFDSYKAHVSKYDQLTGLFRREAFTEAVMSVIKENRDSVADGKYALVYFDIIRFKAINDMFGLMAGDALLKHMADVIVRSAKDDDIACRLEADRFALFTNQSGDELIQFVERLIDDITQYDLTFKITCNVGIYVTNERALSVDSMIDRAVLALSSIKGSYSSRYKIFTESLRNDMLSEQEISGEMATALEDKQFVLYYQPQFNHSTGNLIGVEALVRWMHPEKGIISPGVFIPIFEKNGFITRLDLYVFEQVCIFIRKCMDEGLPLVPVSSNFSRYDIFQPDFVENLEIIRKRHNIPTNLLRVEITESAIVGGSEQANEIVKQLHECGYFVEMDDFGSGYSSLNVLKDIELDLIKLDMMFLVEKSDSNRGGMILSSIVRMAKWLGLPVIAEGVETIEQADFLKSIGCEYIQGYFYSRPLPENQYVDILTASALGEKTTQVKMLDNMNANDFWNPKSQETLIYNNYVGGASVFEYCNGKVDILRVNRKYLEEFDMRISEKSLIEGDPMRFFDEENRTKYLDMLQNAITSGKEAECETWRTYQNSDGKEENLCIRTTTRVVGEYGGDHFLFYAVIRNITEEKKRMEELLEIEKQFNKLSNQ